MSANEVKRYTIWYLARAHLPRARVYAFRDPQQLKSDIVGDTRKHANSNGMTSDDQVSSSNPYSPPPSLVPFIGRTIELPAEGIS